MVRYISRRRKGRCSQPFGTGEDSSIDNYEKHDSTAKENWFRTVYKWIITIDGDPDLNGSKGYRSIPYVTNYIFFFGGRLRTLRHSAHLSIFVMFVILIPMILFSIFEAHKLWHTRYGYKILVIFFYYFWLMSFSSFVRTATCDPGVLPRNVHLGQLHNNCQIPQEYYNAISLPTLKTESDELSKIELKYCTMCRIWRPPRASHCSTCGACIMIHDHHCIWVNNCVGQRNYRYFLVLLLSLTLASIFLIANSSIHIARNTKGPSHVPVTILLLVYGCLCIWYPAILLGYHIFMTGTQQTTREFLKHIGSRNPVFSKITPIQHNVFDKGSFLRNMGSLMLEPRGLSTLSAQERHLSGDWRFINVPDLSTFEKMQGGLA